MSMREPYVAIDMCIIMGGQDVSHLEVTGPQQLNSNTEQQFKDERKIVLRITHI